MDIRQYFTSISSKKDNKNSATACSNKNELKTKQKKDINLSETEELIMKKRKKLKKDIRLDKNQKILKAQKSSILLSETDDEEKSFIKVESSKPSKVKNKEDDEEPLPKKRKHHEKTSKIKKADEKVQDKLLFDEDVIVKKFSKSKLKKYIIDDEPEAKSPTKKKISASECFASHESDIALKMVEKEKMSNKFKHSPKKSPKTKKVTQLISSQQIDSQKLQKTENLTSIKHEKKHFSPKKEIQEELKFKTLDKDKHETSNEMKQVQDEVYKIKKRPIEEDKTELMFVDKYKPQKMQDIIGQQGDRSNVKKLSNWLKNWHRNLNKKPGYGKWAAEDGSGMKAVLLSGPPGIGKTTSAQLVCKVLNFSYIELNASDTRSKKSLTEEVAHLLSNKTLNNYFDQTYIGDEKISSNHVLIMDEIDGIAGNEDRGGIAELIKLIKNTQIPIICICNDRSHPKIRNLANYCFDLRFQRPRLESIKNAMLLICHKEKINISNDVLTELIIASNHDIRQVLHYLFFIASKSSKFEKMQSTTIKDHKLGLFDAVRKVFNAGPEYDAMTFQDKSNLFFCDYSLMPLFIFENYLLVKPKEIKDVNKTFNLVTKAIKCISFADLIDNQIRSSSHWNLLPLQAAFSCVMPGHYLNGHFSGIINFPSILGKISNWNKRDRLLQEVKMHMSLKINGSKTYLNLDYFPALKSVIFTPLKKHGEDGIANAFSVVNYYSLRKEDLDSILELTLWANQKNPMLDISTKTKSAFTRTCNKKGGLLPYSSTEVKIKNKAVKGKGKKGGIKKHPGKEFEKKEKEDEVEVEDEEEDEENEEVECW